MQRRFRRRTRVLVPLAVVATLVTTGLIVPAPQAKPIVEGRSTTLVPGVAHLGWGRAVHTAIPTEMVGFDWAGAVRGTVEVRVKDAQGWTPWTAVDGNPSDGPDMNSREYHGRTSAGPLWIGQDRRDLEVRVTQGDLRDFKLHAIRTEETTGTTLGLAAPSAHAEPGYPSVISRAGWGADESWRTCPPDYADSLRYSFVHHTVSSNGYAPGDVPAIIRGIYYFHTHSNGWCDIGYNFLVDNFGRVWEGRFGGVDRAVIGAHAGGFNTGSTGVALIGTFDTTPVPAAMYNGLRAILGWRLGIAGVDPGATITVTAGAFDGSKYPTGAQVAVKTISGHRDVDQTDCPGNDAYSLLPGLRNDVRNDILGSSHWHSWTGQGGVLSAAPALAAWAPGRLDAFVRGTDNAIWHQWLDGLGWHNWEGLSGPPGGAASAPTVASWGPGHLDVYVLGNDKQLWHRYYLNGWSNTWQSVAAPLGGLSSGPGAASWGQGRIDVFARGVDNTLMHTWYDGGAWRGWESLGGSLTSSPAAASWAPNRVDVVLRGTDNGIWHRWWNGSAWSVWEGQGGVAQGAPAAATWGVNRLDLFVRGTNNGTWHKWWNGSGWSGWENLGGVLKSDPGASAWSFPGRVDVFVQGSDNGAWHQWWG